MSHCSSLYFSYEFHSNSGAFSVNKPNILLIYDKIMQLCQNAIRFLLVGNFKETSLEINKSLTSAFF